MKHNVFRAIVAVVCLAGSSPAVADWNVWTITEARRVLRDEPAGKGAAVKLSAARNEWESFQILMRSDAPVQGVKIDSGDLAGPDGAVLRAADARLFRQHQMELTKATYRNDAFKPGWYPDPLIPAKHPLSGEPLKGARFVAVPFDLPADQTHGFWVDIFVPAGAKPGEYRGAYRATAEGGKAVEIPVAVTVWDFELPRVPTLRTAFGSPAGSIRGYYRERAKAGKEEAPKDFSAIEAQCAAMLSEHGCNATPPRNLVPVAQDDGSYRIPAEQVTALREFADRYHLNALQTVHPDNAVKDPEGEKQRLHAFLASFDRAAAELDRPQVLFYTYLKDEPNDREEYQYVQRWGRAVREAKSVVKVLVVEQTWTQEADWGDLYGAVDVWCPLFSLHKPESAQKRLALGEMVWTYTALCQGPKTPWWHIDFPLLHYRVPAWMAWRNGMTGLLYWGGMSHWRQVDDPWTDPKTYGEGLRGKGPIYNGEGTIVYPARPVGYDGIVPSLRLKALRDSIEDYEYLAILKRLKLGAEADKAIAPLVPSFFQWDADPAAYQKARAKLAELIVASRKKAQ